MRQASTQAARACSSSVPACTALINDPRQASESRGLSFGGIRFLYNDSETTKDGLNLGASVYDATTKTVHVLTNECADEYGEPPCGPTASLLQFSSTSFGETWQPPRNITTDMVAGGFAMLK